MPSARAIVAAAKNYRVAHPDATANMIEDALREYFLGGAPAPAEWARSADPELLVFGAIGGFVVLVYESLFPLDRDTIYSHIKAAVQIAIETVPVASETAGARRSVRLSCWSAALSFAFAGMIEIAFGVYWLALVFVLCGLSDVVVIVSAECELHALRNKQKPSVGANQHRAKPG